MIAPRILTATVEGGRLAAHEPEAPPVPWWSLTKAALAAAALALVDRSRLALDDPLDAGRFSLRQLLQHTAGVPEYGGLAAYHEAVRRGETPWSVDELLRRVEADRLVFPPGQGWAYSNVGYLRVRRLIEATMDTTLDEALRTLVFEPLGVPGIRIAHEPGDLDGTAWGNRARYHPGWVYHGLAVGTAADAALFVHRLLAGPFLSPPLAEAMRQPYPLGGPIEGRPWRTAGYGLGLMVDVDSPRGLAMGHSGQGPGSVSAAYHFPGLARTVSAFAAVEDQGVVERAVLEG